MSAPAGDALARERAAHDLGTSFLVEASAGTGKTTLLVGRIMAILASERASLREIVAITFTEKAAGELQTRVRREIDRTEADGSLSPAIARRARAELGIAPIMTIHAFAASLLRERPVEARLDPAFRVSDEITSRVLLLETWRDWVENVFSQPNDLLARVLEEGADAGSLERLAELLAENRDLVEDSSLRPAQTPPRPEAVLEAARGFYDSLGGRLADCIDPGDRGRRQMEELIRTWSVMRRLPEDDILRWIEEGGLPSPRGDRKKWRRPSTLTRYKDDLQDLAGQVKQLVSVRRQHLVTGLLARMREFLDYYEARRRARGMLDFTDLLFEARNLLRDDREVRRYFQERFRFVLVDEFQDTDPLQAETVFYLAERTPAAEDWREVVLEPGKLFLVGDPKQSIYRFRRADIEVYELARECLLGQPGGRGEVLLLSRNFRSSEPVIRWVNDAFSTLIKPIEGERLQPAYRALEPSEQTAGREGYVRVIGPSPAGLDAFGRSPIPAAERVRLEAELFAGAVERLVPRADSGRASYADITLLLRTLTHVETFTEELARRGLPFRLIAGRSFYERPETHALVSILRAIESPRDRESLVAALRSPAFGVSDEELLLAMPSGLFEGRLAGDAPGHLRDAMALLERFHRERNRGPLAAFIERAVREARLLEVLYLQPEGERRVMNVEKIIAMARSRDREEGMSLGRFVAQLADLMANETREPDYGGYEEGSNEITIMTIHQAKGLEFAHVFLADLCTGRAAGTLFPRLRSHRGRREYALALAQEFTSAGYGDLDEYDEKADACELNRVLYVAATRARNALHVIHPGPVFVATGETSTALKRLDPLLPPVSETELDHAPASRAGRPRAGDAEPAVSEAELTTFDQAEKAWRERLAGARARLEPRARILHPSGFETWDREATLTEEPVPRYDGRDRSTLVGRLVHEFLARALDDGDDALHAALERRLRRDGFDPAERERASTLLERGLASAFVARARQSSRALTEVPFMTAPAAGSLFDAPEFVEGRMDLVFEEDGRLILVDYKTDRVEGPALAERARVYRDALIAYRSAAAELTGMPVEAFLHFIDAGVTVPIDAIGEAPRSS